MRAAPVPVHRTPACRTLAAVVAAVLGLGGCEHEPAALLGFIQPGTPAGRGQERPPKIDPVPLFIRHCAACHGAEGHGDGAAAEQLYPKPRAFHESPMRFASASRGDPRALRAVEQVIRRGIPRSAMPGFDGTMPDAEIAALTEYVVELGREAAAAAGGPAARATGTYRLEPPPFTAWLAAEGARQFRAKGCVGCHGEDGRGAPMPGLVDSRGEPVRPADLATGVYKSGQRPEDLYRAIVDGVPGTPMPGHAELLVQRRADGTVDDYAAWALVAYIKNLAPPVVEGIASGAVLTSQRLADDAALDDPTHPAWLSVRTTRVALRPLWQRTEDALSINVAVVRTGDRVGVHLVWDDGTLDVGNDSALFPDGVAVMFAMGDEAPALPMGVEVQGHAPSAPVNLWQWKASWQYDASAGWRHDAGSPRIVEAGGYQLFGPPAGAPAREDAPPPDPMIDADRFLSDPVFRTAAAVGNVHAAPAVGRAALESNAEGFGTLLYQPSEDQGTAATAVWANRHWFVTMHRALEPGSGDDVAFDRGGRGRRVPVAFAVWDGAKGDRDGIKLISGWHWIVIGD